MQEQLHNSFNSLFINNLTIFYRKYEKQSEIEAEKQF